MVLSFFLGKSYVDQLKLLLPWYVYYLFPHTVSLYLRGLLPHAILLLRRMPVIGHVLNAPGIKMVCTCMYIHVIVSYLYYEEYSICDECKSH